MAEEKRKKGRRAHLSGFAPTAAGEYVYTGPHYAYVEQNGSYKRFLVTQWVLALGCLGCAAAGGCVSGPGMDNTFYVILPWAAGLIAAVSVVWAVARMAYWGNPLRDYVYEKTVAALPTRCKIAAGLAAATGILSGISLLINKTAQKSVFGVCAFFSLQIGMFIMALALLSLIKKQKWEKRP